MREPELFLLFVRPLNRAGIRYVVSGSVAAIFYGEPRLTHDVDFVVFLNAGDVHWPWLFRRANFIFLRPKPFWRRLRAASATISTSFTWTQGSKPIST